MSKKDPPKSVTPPPKVDTVNRIGDQIRANVPKMQNPPPPPPKKE